MSADPRLRLSSENLVLLLAAAVGLGTGLGVVGFRYLIGWCRHLFQELLLANPMAWSSWDPGSRLWHRSWEAS